MKEQRTHSSKASTTRRWFTALFCFILAQISCSDDKVHVRVTDWPEADYLFRHDERWIGGDGALTVDLGQDRILWLFGDSFISQPSERTDKNAFFIRNSVAIQTGKNPTNAFMEFYWRSEDNAAKSYVPDLPGAWYWPGHGVVIENTLVTFWGKLCQEGASGFTNCGGWEVLLVDHPEQSPDQWQPRYVKQPAFDPGVNVGAAVIVQNRFLYAFGTKTDYHDVYLVRWPTQDIIKGDLSKAEWKTSGGWSTTQADAIFEDGSPEFSVHYIKKINRWVMIESDGYGDTTLALRTAPNLTGPWSDVQPFYRPEESFKPKAFVYAGKGHTDIEGADIVLTYVSQDEYVPRFIRLWFDP